MPKGRFPHRRTLEYLSSLPIFLKNSVKAVALYYDAKARSSSGARCALCVCVCVCVCVRVRVRVRVCVCVLCALGSSLSHGPSSSLSSPPGTSCTPMSLSFNTRIPKFNFWHSKTKNQLLFSRSSLVCVFVCIRVLVCVRVCVRVPVCVCVCVCVCVWAGGLMVYFDHCHVSTTYSFH